MIIDNWPWLAGLYKEAMDHGQNESTLTDYLQKLLNYQAQAWVIDDNGKYVGAGLTEILNYSQHKTLHIILFTGDELAIHPEVIEVLDEFAKQNGCTAQEVWGRRGWCKMLPKRIPGFFEAYTVMRRNL